MLDQLGGVYGAVGVLLLLAGLAVVAYADPVVAAGVVLVLVGVGLLTRGVVGNVLESLGMGGML